MTLSSGSFFILRHFCPRGSGMSWTRYLLHDFFTASEFNRIESELKKDNRKKRAADRQLLAEVDRLKDDLGRAYLMISALTELCLRKDLISEDELSQVMRDIDLTDGVEDGKLATQAEDEQPKTPEQFLSELEREDL